MASERMVVLTAWLIRYRSPSALMSTNRRSESRFSWTIWMVFFTQSVTSPRLITPSFTKPLNSAEANPESSA